MIRPEPRPGLRGRVSIPSIRLGSSIPQPGEILGWGLAIPPEWEVEWQRRDSAPHA